MHREYTGFAKHMKSKHSDEQNYLFITPTEYEEATVKEGAVVVAESSNDDNVGICLNYCLWKPASSS